MSQQMAYRPLLDWEIASRGEHPRLNAAPAQGTALIPPQNPPITQLLNEPGFDGNAHRISPILLDLIASAPVDP